MASIRTTIRDNIAMLIAGMTTAGGYNNTWGTVNQPDANLVTYPCAIVRIGQETCNDVDGGMWHEVYQCDAEIEVTFDVQILTEEAVPEFAIDELADEALDDLKRLFGKNPSLSSIGSLPIMYKSSETEAYSSGDYFVVNRIKTLWNIRYNQSRKEPSQIG